MRPKVAEPGVRGPRPAASSSSRNAAILPAHLQAPQIETSKSWADLPERIRDKLARHGINSAQDWLALNVNQRNGIFGITKAIQFMVTTAASEARSGRDRM